jgi:hypothetical protein
MKVLTEVFLQRPAQAAWPAQSPHTCWRQAQRALRAGARQPCRCNALVHACLRSGIGRQGECAIAGRQRRPAAVPPARALLRAAPACAAAAVPVGALPARRGQRGLGRPGGGQPRAALARERQVSAPASPRRGRSWGRLWLPGGAAARRLPVPCRTTGSSYVAPLPWARVSTQKPCSLCRIPTDRDLQPARPPL